MSVIIKRFLQHFFVSGTIIAIMSLVIETQDYNIPVAIAYSGIPFAAIYLIMVAYNIGGAKNAQNLAYHFFLTGLFIASIFHLLLYLSITEMPLLNSMILSALVAGLCCMIYYRYFTVYREP